MRQAAEIIQLSVDRLIPNARNARTHDDAQVAQIAASIREFGFTVPVLIDAEDGIIAGHGRVMAARKLGLDSVPCIRVDYLSETQKRAYILADNKLTLNGGWDADMLALELKELGDAGIDLGLTGFSNEEILGIVSSIEGAGLTDPDDAPPLPENAVSVRGDVWILGRHRILCGDSTVPTDVEKVLAGVKPHLMVTDPPYGVNYDPAWRLRVGIGSAGTATGKVLNDDRADWREAWALFPGNVAYVWHAGLFADVVADSLRACKFDIRAQIVWVKTRHVLSRGHYHPQHEPALYGVREEADDGWRFVPEHEVSAYAVKKGATAQWVGGRKQSTVWFIEHLKSDTGHGTQKPVECMKRPIENNSSPGQAIYEPFSGSGTTIISAEMTGRTCHAIELNPAYVDVAVKRWQAFTGKRARRESDGVAFDDAA